MMRRNSFVTVPDRALNTHRCPCPRAWGLGLGHLLRRRGCADVTGVRVLRRGDGSGSPGGAQGNSEGPDTKEAGVSGLGRSGDSAAAKLRQGLQIESPEARKTRAREHLHGPKKKRSLANPSTLGFLTPRTVR